MGKTRIASVQTAPRFLDLPGTVDKACSLIREAAGNGASIVAFPEAFIPAYPYWVWLEAPLEGAGLFKRLYENSVTVPGQWTDVLCEAAREHNAVVVMGLNEVDPVIFVAASTSLLDDAALGLIADTPAKRKRLEGRNYALTAVYGPDGRAIGGPLIDEEGIVYADLDLADLIAPKMIHDITGHYNQFGVLSLHLNRTAQAPLVDDSVESTETDVLGAEASVRDPT